MGTPNPGPWVNPELQEEAPWKTRDGIVKFIEFPVPMPGMSPRAFHLYWQKHHSPNVMNITSFAQFMRKYNSGHKYPNDPLKLPARYNQSTPFEGVAEVWLNSINEVGDWFSNPNYPQLIQPDEARFISQNGDVQVIVTKEERLYEPELDMVESLKSKVYLIFRRPDGADYDAFHGAASEHAKLILEQAPLKGRLRKLVLSHKLREPLPLEGFQMSDIDAVLELWFDDLDEAKAFFEEPAYSGVVVENETKVFADGARGLVARMRVVHDEFSFQPSTTQPMPFSWT